MVHEVAARQATTATATRRAAVRRWRDTYEGRRSRYGLADKRIAHALDDLIGLVLAVDPTRCPDADTEACC